MFDIPIPEPKSLEQIEIDRRARTVGRLETASAAHPDREVFSAVSLSAWSRLAAEAGVPAVGAEVACTISIGAILRSEEPTPADIQEMSKLSAVRSALRGDEMLRWDCCASMDMKGVMSKGEDKAMPYELRPDRLNPGVPSWRTITSLDDPRFMDIVFDYPGDEVPVIKRPWVQARMEGAHPAEYRVFVRNGEIEGVANYYLQRDLQPDDQVSAEVAQAIAHTRKLISHMERTGALPFNLGAEGAGCPFDPDKASCTIDYLVSQEGDVLLLEAGPPFGLGAHPCAFMENTSEVGGRQVISVQGVCLGLGKPALPLSDFEPGSGASLRP